MKVQWREKTRESARLTRITDKEPQTSLALQYVQSEAPVTPAPAKGSRNPQGGTYFLAFVLFCLDVGGGGVLCERNRKRTGRHCREGDVVGQGAPRRRERCWEKGTRGEKDKLQKLTISLLKLSRNKQTHHPLRH